MSRASQQSNGFSPVSFTNICVKFLWQSISVSLCYDASPVALSQTIHKKVVSDVQRCFKFSGVRGWGHTALWSGGSALGWVSHRGSCSCPFTCSWMGNKGCFFSTMATTSSFRSPTSTFRRDLGPKWCDNSHFSSVEAETQHSPALGLTSHFFSKSTMLRTARSQEEEQFPPTSMCLWCHWEEWVRHCDQSEQQRAGTAIQAERRVL